MKRMLLIAAIFALPFAHGQSSVFPAPERAEGRAETKPTIGVFTGVAGAEGADQEAWEYGVEAAFQPVIPFSLALELSGFTKPSDGPDAALTRTRLLGKALYNMGGTIPVIRHSWVGAGLGPVYDNIRNDQDWNLGFLPTAGFDIPIGAIEDRLSLGAHVAYLIVTGDNPNSLSANGVLKYWF